MDSDSGTVPKPVSTNADEHGCDFSSRGRRNAAAATSASQATGPDATSVTGTHATTPISPSAQAGNPTRASEGLWKLASGKSHTPSAVPGDSENDPA